MLKTTESIGLAYALTSLAGAPVVADDFPSNGEKIRAFPSAEGFGAYAEGGRGGRTLHVTNLKDEGPGSLRWAIEEEGPRTVVFEVSGTITLQDEISIENPYITIAGQTAPGDGICIRNNTLEIQTHDVIVRHIRSRLGAQGGGGDSISIQRGRDIIVDHCSAGWSTDEALSASTGAPELTNVTVQWCLITEALNPENHGYGSLIRGTGGARYSFHHNLYAHNRGRNPRPGNYDRNPHDEDPDGLLLDFRNNVIYNWAGGYAGYNADTISVTRMNYVGNFLLPGPDSDANGIAYRTGSPFNRAYFNGNFYGYAQPDDPWDIVDFDSAWSDREVEAYKQTKPFPAGSVERDDAWTAFYQVLAHAGASRPGRDAVDTRVIDEVQRRTGRIIDSQDEVGGWPKLDRLSAPPDSDRDGMPDGWEAVRGLDPDHAEDAQEDRDGDGYTNLEEYLHALGEVSPQKQVGSHQVD